MNQESVLQTESRFFNVLTTYKLLENAKDVVCFFSGGKDATFCLYLLNKYITLNGLNISLKATMLLYPTHVYFDDYGREREGFVRSKSLCDAMGVQLLTLQSPKEDLKEGSPGCTECKDARLDLVYQASATYPGGVVLVSGYTLYDAMAYVSRIAIATGYTFDLKLLKEPQLVRTVRAYLHKLRIKEPFPNGVTFVRPMLPFSDDVIRDYLDTKQLDYVREECRVSEHNYKRVYFKSLALMRETNSTTYEGLLNFLNQHGIELPTTYEDLNSDIYYRDC